MGLRAFSPLLVVSVLACSGRGTAPSVPENGQRGGAGRALPGDDEVVGWRRAEPERRYSGSGLYGHIDGGAELFLELGFEEVRVQSYRRGEDELTVEFYRMRDEIAAVGAYLANQGEPRRDATFAERLRIGSRQLVFQKGRYYVLITNYAGKRELAPAMLEFAHAVAAKLPRGAAVALLDLLPAKDRVAGSQRLIRGRTGLEAIVTLGAGDILLLGGKVTAVAASYRGAGGSTYTRILVLYAAPPDARAAFRNLIANLDSYLEVADKTDTRLVFRDFAGKWGEAAVRNRRLDIRVRLDARP